MSIDPNKIKNAFESLASQTQSSSRTWGEIRRRITRRHQVRLAVSTLAAAGAIAAVVTVLPSNRLHRAVLPAASSPVKTPTATASPLPANNVEDPYPSLIAFASTTRGWVVAPNDLLGTTDGGHTWASELGDHLVSYLNVLDEQHAWLISDGGLWSLQSGKWGQTYDAVKTSGNSFVQAQFFDASHGWAVDSSGRVLSTADGGKSFVEVKGLPGPAESACMVNDKYGLASVRGTIYTYFGTHDPHPWDNPLRADDGWVGSIRCRAGSAWFLRVGGAAAGSRAYNAWSVTAATDRIGSTLILKDRFGGTMTNPPNHPVDSIDNYPGPFDFIGENTAIFAGFCPACGRGSVSIVRSVDGGNSWTHAQASALEGHEAWSMSFVDADHGWMLVHDTPGSIYSTSDGGKTWQRLYQGAGLSSPVSATAHG